jgi:hypothetical protein
MALLTEFEALRTLRNDIPYWEFPGNSERYTDDGTEVVRRLGCYWRDRQDFLLDILGDARIVGPAGTTGAKIRRDLPEQHPDFDDFSGQLFSMWATDAAFVEGLGWPGRDETTNSIAYHDSPPEIDTDQSGSGDRLRAANGEGLAVYDVTYRPTRHYMYTDEEVDGFTLGERERYTFVTREPGAENLPVTKGWLEYQSGDKAPELAPQIFPTAIVNIHWLMVPEAAYRRKTVEGYWNGSAVVPGYVGSVNDAVFVIGDDSYEAETLLGLAPKFRPYIHANTGLFFDIIFPFQYRPAGHNRFLRNADTWERLVRVADNSKGPFPTFDMSKIFDPANV